MLIYALLFACTANKKTPEHLLKMYTCKCSIKCISIAPRCTTHTNSSDVISDGSKIWMTYNLPNEESKFDVFLVSFGCDGSIQDEAKQILNISGMNQTTPQLLFHKIESW